MEIKSYKMKVFYTFVLLLIIYGIVRVNIDTFRRLRAEEEAKGEVVYIEDEEAYDIIEQDLDNKEQDDIEQMEINYAD